MVRDLYRHAKPAVECAQDLQTSQATDEAGRVAADTKEGRYFSARAHSARQGLHSRRDTVGIVSDGKAWPASTVSYICAD